MGIVLGSNFDVQTNLPLDSRLKVADSTARDAIDSGVRYEGMIVYVVADGTNYQLVGGIDNANWAELSGSGGGGIAVNWFQNGNGPIQTILGNIPVWQFGAGLAQELYTIVNIPSTYKAGGQINLLAQFISENTSGTVLFRAQATLLLAETTEYDNTTNQRTTTNSAVTMSGANDRQFINLTLDISSSIGQVNAVSIQPKAKLLVRFYRDTDTAAGNAFLVIGSEEVTIV